ncbi:MAG TPA: hypothetical protein DCY07_04240 [Rhodospirillaceae bacterium]|nr:hypothetical protein [Rhodospirillaceae bacterium]
MFTIKRIKAAFKGAKKLTAPVLLTTLIVASGCARSNGYDPYGSDASPGCVSIPGGEICNPVSAHKQAVEKMWEDTRRVYGARYDRETPRGDNLECDFDVSRRVGVCEDFKTGYIFDCKLALDRYGDLESMACRERTTGTIIRMNADEMNGAR